MHVLVTGGTGFIGSALVPALLGLGHEVTVLTRQHALAASESTDRRPAFVTDLNSMRTSPDAVINLAGASLADKRWSAKYKAEIRSSRIDFTRDLGLALRKIDAKPSVWINGSAIGYYGASLEASFVESDSQGDGFAAQLCADWEQEAVNAGGDARLCLLRLGVVLDNGGGAFAQMSQPFKFGVANWIGHGEQWLSWIHRDDVVQSIIHLLGNAGLSGAFNVTAPTAVTSREFCREMRRHYRTWIAMPMPAAAMRMMVGAMADELLLQGQRVEPQALLVSGFTFEHGNLESALSDIK